MLPLLSAAAFVLLLRSYRRQDAQQNMFLLSLLLCAMTLLVPDAVVLFPLVWLAFFMLRASNIRVYSASLIAVLTVALYVGLTCVLWPDNLFVHYEMDVWSNALNRTWRFWEAMPLWMTGVSAFVLITGLTAIIAHLQRYSRANVRIQTRVLLAAPAFILSMLVGALPPESGCTLVTLYWISGIYLMVLYLMTYGFPRFRFGSGKGTNTRRLSRRADSQNPFRRKAKPVAYDRSRRSFSRRSRQAVRR